VETTEPLSNKLSLTLSKSNIQQRFENLLVPPLRSKLLLLFSHSVLSDSLQSMDCSTTDSADQSPYLSDPIVWLL